MMMMVIIMIINDDEDNEIRSCYFNCVEDQTSINGCNGDGGEVNVDGIIRGVRTTPVFAIVSAILTQTALAPR